MRDIENVFNKDEINFFLNDTTVKEYQEMIQTSSKYCLNFSIKIPSDIKKTIGDKLGCYIQDDMLPMRWIKNDTKPHVDMNAEGQEYKSTIVYLTDSEGTIHTKKEFFNISQNKGFIIDMNEVHWTKGTITPRLLVGPMNAVGVQVGGVSPGFVRGYSYSPWFDWLKRTFIPSSIRNRYNQETEKIVVSENYLPQSELLQQFTNTDDTCKKSTNKINVYVLIILIILFIIIILLLANSIVKNNNPITKK